MKGVRLHTLAFATFGLGLGCGEPVDEEVASERVVAATDGFASEAWGIGPSWYDYDSATHAVTPKPIVYVVEKEEPLAFSITGYYDDQGTSGFVGFETVEGSMRLDTNIKEEPACLRLDPLEEVECVDGPDLLVTTIRRPLPEAGFAVRNPGLWVLPGAAKAVWRVTDSDVATVASNPDWKELATQVETVTGSTPGRLGELDGVHLHVDGDLGLAAWTVTERDGAFDFEARCTEATHPSETPLAGANSVSFTWSPEPGLHTIDICESAVEPAVRWLGLWPQGTWDVMVEVSERGVSFTLHPELLHWNWGMARGVDTVDDALKADVWEGLEE